MKGFRSRENPARWKGNLDHLFPARSKVRPIRHHPSLPYVKVGEFVSELAQRTELAARALEFLILTATRTSEALQARWDEVDFERKIWTIPARRMKAAREHRVPLSDRALLILSELHQDRISEYVFAGMKSGRPLSQMALLMLLRRLDSQSITVHGFRSTFRDWTAEQTNFSREVAEAELAHTISNAVEAAYRRVVR